MQISSWYGLIMSSENPNKFTYSKWRISFSTVALLPLVLHNTATYVWMDGWSPWQHEKWQWQLLYLISVHQILQMARLNTICLPYHKVQIFPRSLIWWCMLVFFVFIITSAAVQPRQQQAYRSNSGIVYIHLHFNFNFWTPGPTLSSSTAAQ